MKPNRMYTMGSWLAVALTLTSPAFAAPQGIVNGDFANDLENWQVIQSGGSSEPGTIKAANGTAVITEGRLIPGDASPDLRAGDARGVFELFRHNETGL